MKILLCLLTLLCGKIRWCLGEALRSNFVTGSASSAGTNHDRSYLRTDRSKFTQDPYHFSSPVENAVHGKLCGFCSALLGFEKILDRLRFYGITERLTRAPCGCYRRHMQALLEDIVRRFGADTGSIHLLEDGVLVLKAQVGLPPRVAEIVALVPIGKGMAGLAVERNEPVSSCNIQSDETGSVNAGARQTGVNGAIVVPVRDSAGHATGALGIGTHRPYDYTAEETARLMADAATLVG